MLYAGKVEESAAKPGSYFREGSETIPRGSTLLDYNNGSASPLTGNAEGEDIVHEVNVVKKHYF